MSADAALKVWVNGEPLDPTGAAIASNDRGLQYGDGLFETMLWQNGQVRFLDDHLARLSAGCRRLGLPVPQLPPLIAELEKLTEGHAKAILKLILTRGAGGRGYRPPQGLRPTRIASLYAPPESVSPGSGLKLRRCTTCLARNSMLAGMKHLNRLEQVLAQLEPTAPDIAEGLMLDTEGELIGGALHNVFFLQDGILVTPDLRYSGVAGVMRKNVLAAAGRIGVPAEQRAVWPQELETASEIFLTNAVRGIRPVHGLEAWRWATGSVTRALADELRMPVL